MLGFSHLEQENKGLLTSIFSTYKTVLPNVKKVLLLFNLNPLKFDEEKTQLLLVKGFQMPVSINYVYVGGN